MPSSSDRLKEKFGLSGATPTDGIAKAEKIIVDAGGKVSCRGIISYAGPLTSEISDAIEFLIDEWDYAWE